MESIHKVVPRHLCGKFFATQSTALVTKTKKAHANCENKFNHLMNSHMQIFTINAEESNVYNFSGMEVPKNVTKILSLGPKFSLVNTPKEIPYFKIIADFEGIIESTENRQSREELRCKLSNILMNHSYKQKNITADNEIKYMQKLYNETKDFLQDMKRNEKELTIINADKGNKTVILQKEQSEKMVTELISDESTYEKLESDPTIVIEKLVNDTVQDFYNKKWID